MVTAKQLEAFCDEARRLGVLDAVVVAPARRCRRPRGCGWGANTAARNMGKCWTCPPHSPTADITRKMLDEYRAGILLHGSRTGPLREIARTLETRIFLAGHYKAFAFLSGPATAAGPAW